MELLPSLLSGLKAVCAAQGGRVAVTAMRAEIEPMQI